MPNPAPLSTPTQGPTGWAWCWAWDTARQPGSLLTPMTIYGHFQAPMVPAPGPVCFPGTQAVTGRGPGAPSPPMAMCPPGCQGPGPRGRGTFLQRDPEPASPPIGPETDTSILPGDREAASPSLKGHEPITGSGPLPRRGHLQSTPRQACSPSVSQHQIKKLLCGITTYRPGQGSERVSYSSKVTQPWTGCDLRERPALKSCS